MLRRYGLTAADVFLRAIIVIVFTPHALGKLLDTDAFSVKFSVPSWQTYALGSIELAAAAAMLIGLFLVSGGGQRWARVVLTRLGSLGVVLSQVLAIVYAHHAWLEYVPKTGNMEYNVTLILVALALAAAPILGFQQRENVELR